MIHRTTSVILLVVGLAGLSASVRGDEPAADPKDSTFCEAVIDAPRAKAWAAYTTKEGLESWCVAHASIDLRLGGIMKTRYDPAGELGDSKTIENEILAFDPEHMIVLKVKKAPDGFPFPTAVKKIWHVLYFEDADSGRTRVKCRGLGYAQDEESQKMRAFFAKGNAHTLEELSAHFKKSD